MPDPQKVSVLVYLSRGLVVNVLNNNLFSLFIDSMGKNKVLKSYDS